MGLKEDLQALGNLLATMDMGDIGPWLLIIGGLASLIWINFGGAIRRFRRKSVSPEELAERCDKMSEDITEFLFERRSGGLAFFPEDEKESNDKSYERFKRRAAYSDATRNLYTKRFNSPVHDLYELLKENGHTPNDRLLFGQDAFADQIAADLTSYARILREGGIINYRMRADDSINDGAEKP